LRLLTTHFPQLCIANEWLEDSVGISDQHITSAPSRAFVDFDIPPENFAKGFNLSTFVSNCCRKCTKFLVKKCLSAFAVIVDQPAESIRLLEACKELSPHKLWSYAKEIVSQVRKVAHPSVARKIQGRGTVS